MSKKSKIISEGPWLEQINFSCRLTTLKAFPDYVFTLGHIHGAAMGIKSLSLIFKSIDSFQWEWHLFNFQSAY